MHNHGGNACSAQHMEEGTDASREQVRAVKDARRVAIMMKTIHEQVYLQKCAGGHDQFQDHDEAGDGDPTVCQGE